MVICGENEEVKTLKLIIDINYFDRRPVMYRDTFLNALDNKAYKELSPLKLISQAMKSWQDFSTLLEFAKRNNGHP